MPHSSDINPDIIYEALCKTCDVLDQISCPYYLAGGTLLGARRDGDIIPHDIDFDLDCLVENEEKILNAAEIFAKEGLSLKRQLSLAPRNFVTMQRTTTPLYVSCIHVGYDGYRVGDIYIFTVFDDGIARRFDLASGVYANCKMSIPAWYYAKDDFLKIRNRKFRSVRAPDIVLEKVYGKDWRIPLKPGQFKQGRNASSGSVPDADIEQLVLYAVKNGWEPCYADKPKWPQTIRWIGWPTDIGKNWVLRHEPMTHSKVASVITDASYLRMLDQADTTQKQALLRVLASKAIQSESERLQLLAAHLNSKQSLIKRLYLALGLPDSWRANLSKIYNLIFRCR